MDKHIDIERLTEIILALNSMKILVGKLHGNKSIGSQRSGEKLGIIEEIMSTAGNLVPQNQKSTFNSAYTNCMLYSKTYRNIKNHLRSVQSQEPSINSVSKTVELIMPLLDKRNRLPLIKIVSLIKAIQS